MLLGVIVGCRLYSSAWGVIWVSIDFKGETLILFECVQCVIVVLLLAGGGMWLRVLREDGDTVGIGEYELELVCRAWRG